MGITAKKPEKKKSAQPALVVGTSQRQEADEWPMRPLHSSVSGRAERFQVVFGAGVVEDIRAHGLLSPDVEVCGVLVGSIYRDHADAYCYVEANIRGTPAAGRNAQVTFTSETWALINQTMDTRYPDRRIVGWYHTHPGFGIFLSEMDLFIHRNFFSEPWQVAYVDDPKGGDRGVFVWQNDSLVREPHLVENDARSTEKKQNPNPRMVWDDVGREDEPAAPVTVNKTSEPPLEWAARFRVLERQLQRHKRNVRWFALGAVLWPMVVVAVLFWSGILPREKLKGLSPGTWLHQQTGATSARPPRH